MLLNDAGLDAIGRVELECTSELLGGIRLWVQRSLWPRLSPEVLFYWLDNLISVSRSYGAEGHGNSHFHSGWHVR